MSSRRHKLLARVNWYLQSSLKHITELITGNNSYYRGGRYRQVSQYLFLHTGSHINHRLSMMEVVRNEGARTLTAQCRLSLWKPVYHLVKRGIDVNKQDEHGQTPLCAAMAAPTEPYRHFGMGSLGGLWPQQFMRFRLDDETRQELVGSQRFVVPCLSGRRVPDKECIIELLLKAGANPNLVPNNQCNSPNWLWARAFKSSAYNLPLVRALILANADVCCPVPDYHKDKLGGDADMTLLDCTFEICRLRLARYTEQEGSVMIICPNTDCFFKIMRCTIRCLELMRIAGATIFQKMWKQHKIWLKIWIHWLRKSKMRRSHQATVTLLTFKLV